jgi:hypothetical protein
VKGDALNILPQSNSLCSILEAFARRYEFSFKRDLDGQGALLGIPIPGHLIQCKYGFDPSQRGYEFIATLAAIGSEDLERAAVAIITGEMPVRGITERIINGTLVLLGSRDMVNPESTLDVERAFMDDIYRITKYFDELDDRLR